MYSQITSNKRQSVALITIFIVILLVLGYVFGIVSGIGDLAGLFLATILSFIITMVSYFKGDKIALASSGAKAIGKEENPYVYRMIENLCITSGLPVPKVYIINDPAINAFATGRNPETASVAVTTGAIEQLTNEELEGVLAHEMSHIQNYDIRFMMLVAVLVGSIAILSNILLRSGHLRGRSREGGNVLAVFMLVGIVLAILSPLVAELIKLAISRRREYLADASGTLLTRYPEALAKALEKIGAQNMPMQNASKATAHLFFANPFSGKKLANLFSTHPPIQDRINKLRNVVV